MKGNSKYPWDRWFAYKRGWFLIRKGRDFDTSTASMAQQVRNAATRRDLRVSLSYPNETEIRVEVVS